jgi:hypothetical protein
VNCHVQFICFARSLSCSGCGVVRFCNAEHQKMASRGTGSVCVCVCVRERERERERESSSSKYQHVLPFPKRKNALVLTTCVCMCVCVRVCACVQHTDTCMDVCVYTHIIHIHRSVGLLLGRHSDICPLLREWRLALKVSILYIHYIYYTVRQNYTYCTLCILLEYNKLWMRPWIVNKLWMRL